VTRRDELTGTIPAFLRVILRPAEPEQYISVYHVGGAIVDFGLRRTTISRRQPIRHDAEEMMKYLCLVYHDEQRLDALPASEYNALVAETRAYDEELQQRGHYLSANTLDYVEASTSGRVGNGRVSVTDGPSAEAREQLGGFILIEAGDVNEALQVASKMPSARMGRVDVRPIKECTLLLQ
jgi:hypothetical protein